MFDEDECLTLKEIERLLDREIFNWIRWARQRNYLPASVKCVLGDLYVPKLSDQATGDVKPLPPNEAQAELFEAIVVGLPSRLRKAFVLQHLERGHVGSVTVRVKKASDKARVMGVGNRHWNRILSDASNLVLRRWRLAQRK